MAAVMTRVEVTLVVAVAMKETRLKGTGTQGRRGFCCARAGAASNWIGRSSWVDAAEATMLVSLVDRLGRLVSFLRSDGSPFFSR